MMVDRVGWLHQMEIEQMHPARLSFLAGRHTQERDVVSCIRNNKGHWELMLSCGHAASCVGHMDASLVKTWRCYSCGEIYVKLAPQYAKEFKITVD